MKKITIALLVWSSLSISYAQSSIRNQKEVATHIRNTALITAIPTNKTYSNNDWNVLSKLYPTAKWSQFQSKKYSEARRANISKEILVSAQGARTMIVVSTFEFTTLESGQDLFSLLKLVGTISEQLCDSQELASFRERYFIISIPGYQPLRGIYELSSGSASTSQSIIFSNDISIPKIGSPAANAVWTKNC